MPPSIPTETTHYALVIDAGSSGSRLQVYSWRDPDLERAEIVQEVRDALSPSASASSSASGNESGSSKKWWWPTGSSRKGKGKAREEEFERKALRRLVRVGKGVEGDEWVKRVEPGKSPHDLDK
jgi:Golgi apyrase